MPDIEGLKKSIYRTMEDIDLWQDVLQAIIEISGASKGIITLRDRSTAELVIPDDVRHELNSPLLCGFSEAEIESYIINYVQEDPWTQYERLYHPVSPYALSEHVGRTQLQASKFWEWLGPQDIDDSVVLDIGTISQHWVAMNIYYRSADKEVGQTVLELTKELQLIMQDAWRYGQKLRAAQKSQSHLSYFLEQHPSSAVLLNPDKSLVNANEKALKLFKRKVGVYIDHENVFRVEDKKLDDLFNLATTEIRAQSIDLVPGERSDEEILHGDLSFTLTLIESANDTLGNDQSMYLVIIKNLSDQKLTIWNNPILTKRERQLVEQLAKGNGIADFYRLYKIGKSTGHFHWINVKKKLHVKDKAEIFALHQIYLKNL